jgi:hypothetical protein
MPGPYSSCEREYTVDGVWHQGKSIQDDVGEMLWDLVPTARHLLADPAAPDFPIDEPTEQASAFRGAYRDAMWRVGNNQTLEVSAGVAENAAAS